MEKAITNPVPCSLCGKAPIQQEPYDNNETYWQNLCDCPVELLAKVGSPEEESYIQAWNDVHYLIKEGRAVETLKHIARSGADKGFPNSVHFIRNQVSVQVLIRREKTKGYECVGKADSLDEAIQEYFSWTLRSDCEEFRR